MKKKNIVCYAVMIELPEGATSDMAKEYILDAVQSWRGSLPPAGARDDDDPGDPMFYLDRDSVKVS